MLDEHFLSTRPSSQWHLYSEVGSVIIPAFADGETKVQRGKGTLHKLGGMYIITVLPSREITPVRGSGATKWTKRQPVFLSISPRERLSILQ